MAIGGHSRWPGFVVALLLAAILPVSAPDSVSALPAAGSVGTSDDFEAPNVDLNTWAPVDPSGRGQISLALGTVAFAPGGDSWVDDFSTRIEQLVEDDDFDVVLEFPSLPTARYSAVGLSVRSGSSWLRIGLTGTGEGTSVVAIANQGSTPLVRVNHPVGPDTARMRVTRSGAHYLVWVAPASGDWQLAGSFVEYLPVERMALFGAARDPAAPAVAISDFSATEPVVDHGDDTTGPLIQAVTTRSQGDDLVVTFSTDEPAAASLLLGTGDVVEGSSELILSHEITLPDQENGAKLTFQPVARDDLGNTSEGPRTDAIFTEEGRPVIDIWYGDRQTFGQNGLPQRWVNILGNVSDEDGLAELTYSLDGGPSKPLSIGPSDRRLAMPGDFNADLALAEMANGEHTVRFDATDNLGNTNSREVTVVIANTLGLPVPHSVVWAEAAETSLNDIAQVVDGKWYVEQDGSLRTAEIGYDRVVAIGDQRWFDYEVVFPITIHEVSPEGYSDIDGEPNMALTVGWTGHHEKDRTQPPWGFWPSTGAAGFYWDTLEDAKMKTTGNGGIPSQSSANFQIPLETKVWMRVRVEVIDDGPRVSMRAWADGSTEPSDWTVSVTDDDDTVAGSIAIVAHHVDASIGDVQVELLSS